jgi:hypothetical protein
MKRTASAQRTTKSSGSSRKRQSARRPLTHSASRVRFALYTGPDRGDLRHRTLYPLIRDVQARKEGLVRVVDDSGEDYLYPADSFVTVRLPASVAKQLD